MFGCGGDRDRGKRPHDGARSPGGWPTSPIVTSDNPRSEDPEAIIAEIMDGVAMDAEPDRRAAIERAVGLAPGAGDVVVIAGKGHEQGQEFADRTLPFDDRTVAREALAGLAAGMIALTARRDRRPVRRADDRRGASCTGVTHRLARGRGGRPVRRAPGTRTDGARFTADALGRGGRGAWSRGEPAGAAADARRSSYPIR